MVRFPVQIMVGQLDRIPGLVGVLFCWAFERLANLKQHLMFHYKLLYCCSRINDCCVCVLLNFEMIFISKLLIPMRGCKLIMQAGERKWDKCLCINSLLMVFHVFVQWVRVAWKERFTIYWLSRRIKDHDVYIKFLMIHVSPEMFMLATVLWLYFLCLLIYGR